MDRLLEKARRVLDEVNQVILGKEQVTEEVLLAFLADGHVLLEDIPGVGKTTLALAFSKAMDLDFRRVQFTPDLMPSDLTGFSIYRREEERFVYQPGCVFCNLLLADEINRTSPKTQSALLEVMEERRVSVDGVTREVEPPFLVIATQNPAGSAGTQPLPEAQVDRFIVTAALGYPDFENELELAMGEDGRSRAQQVNRIIGKEELRQIKEEIDKIYVKESVYRYLLELITATRTHPYLERGASPRGTIGLVNMSKAMAWLHGERYVTPENVEDQFIYVVSHRVILNGAARMEKVTKRQILQEILRKTGKPPMGEK